MAAPADSQALKPLSNLITGTKPEFRFQRYAVKFRKKKLSRRQDKEEQDKREIETILALQAAKNEALMDDHDDAFKSVMGSQTSVLEGGQGTSHANVGGRGGSELELEDELLVKEESDTR